MKYLTIGKDNLSYNKFNEIKDIDIDKNMAKPSGGLWLTKHNELINYSIWMDYILEHKKILFHKYKEYMNKDSSWEIPCSLVTLSKDSSVFILDDYDKYCYLLRKYPLNNKSFSYKDMVASYDGIYVDLNWNQLSKAIDLSRYGVDSLLLYNLKCIDNYRVGKILVESFDAEDYNMYDNVLYDIRINNEKRKVLCK